MVNPTKPQHIPPWKWKQPQPMTHDEAIAKQREQGYKERHHVSRVSNTPTPTQTGGYVPQGQPKTQEQVSPHEKYESSVQKVRDTPFGNTISSKNPILISDNRPTYTYEQWQRTSPIFRQNIEQSSRGIFSSGNILGIQELIGRVTGETEQQRFYKYYQPTLFNIKEATRTPTKAVMFAAFDTLPGVYYTSVIGGAGVGALTKVAPAFGTIVKTGLFGYGAYSVEEATVKPALKGDIATLKTNLLNIGVTLPFIGHGFKTGYNLKAIGKLPTLTTRGVKTLATIQTKAITPIKTTINRLNPVNLWVRAGAVKIEDYIDKEVVLGKKTFPTERTVQGVLKAFNKGLNPITGKIRVVHATSVFKFKVGEIPDNMPARPSDVPGLYVSSYGRASPYFLRLGVEQPDYTYRPMDIGVLPKRPSFQQFEVMDISRAPRGVRTSISRFMDWQKGISDKSTATITPMRELGKPEIEAVINPGSEFNKAFKPSGFLQQIKGYGKYTEYSGRNIPIKEYDVLGEGLGKGASTERVFKELLNTNKYMESYSTKSFLSLYNSHRGSSVKQSNASSYATPSYKPSYSVRSYKPAYNVPRYKPPSYTPSSDTPSSDKPSYRPPSYTPPSYTPKSYTPSYKTPSYRPSKYTPPFYYSDKETKYSIGDIIKLKKTSEKYKFREFKILDLNKIFKRVKT